MTAPAGAMGKTGTEPLDLAQFAGHTLGPWDFANARLIAAAPAILAECQRLRDQNEKLRLVLRHMLEDADADSPNSGAMIEARALLNRSAQVEK